MATDQSYLNYGRPQIRTGAPPTYPSTTVSRPFTGERTNYTGTDADKMAQSDRNRAIEREQQFFDTSTGRMQTQEALEDYWRGQGYDQYAPILRGEGGYDPKETAAIMGNPEAEQKYFNPAAQNKIEASGAAGQRGAVSEAQQALTRNNTDAMLAFPSDYLPNLYENADQEAQALNAAAEDESLGLSGQFRDNYLMGDQERRDYENLAAQGVNSHYAAAVDAINRKSVAEGSGAPGMGALRLRAERQMAADAGEAGVSARLQASNAAAERQRTMEDMRLNAAGGQAGLRMQAAQAGGDAGYRALTTGEQDRSEAARYLADLRSQNAQYVGSLKAGTEGDIASRAQDNARDIRDFGAGQSRYIDQTKSERAQGIADTRKGEEQEARGYLVNQGTQAQQGYQDAAAGRIQGEGVTTGAQSQATDTRMRSHVASTQKPGLFSQLVGAGLGAAAGFATGGPAGAVTGAAGGWQKKAEGDVITKPTAAILGDQGPEMIVPLDGHQGAKVPPRFAQPRTSYLQATQAAPVSQTMAPRREERKSIGPMAAGESARPSYASSGMTQGVWQRPGLRQQRPMAPRPMAGSAPLRPAVQPAQKGWF